MFVTSLATPASVLLPAVGLISMLVTTLATPDSRLIPGVGLLSMFVTSLATTASVLLAGVGLLSMFVTSLAANGRRFHAPITINLVHCSGNHLVPLIRKSLHLKS